MDIKQEFETIRFLILQCQTFDIGTLQAIQNKVIVSKDLQTLYYEIVLTFQTIYDHMKKTKSSHKRYQYLVVLVINSLILNIYAQTHNSNLSELNNSLSASQSSFFSVTESSLIQDNVEVQAIVLFVYQLSQDEEFFKKMHQLTQYNKFNTEVNRRTLYGFIETLDYILSREKMEKSKFYLNKKILTTLGSFVKPSYAMHVQKVNQVIFSGKLNMIESLLQDNSQKLGFSLSRIYYAATNLSLSASHRKCFTGIPDGGGQIMIYNLYKIYISQFSRKSELFINTKSALFEFIMATFCIEFLPVIISFATIFKKMIIKVEGQYQKFFQICQTLIREQLLCFIADLPPNLLYRLNLLKIIISNHDKWKDLLTDSLAPVKMFFLNRFLFSSIYLDLFFGQQIMQQAEVIANFINDLFFTQSVKKYLDNEMICKLIQQVSEMFETTLSYHSEQLESDSNSYFVQQLILKHDYQQMYQGLLRAKFSPKDQTQFIMASLHKDIITSRTKRTPQNKLSGSDHVRQQQIQNIIFHNIKKGKTSYEQFLEGMQTGESKLSLFLKSKQQKQQVQKQKQNQIKKQKESQFPSFNIKKKEEFQSIFIKYKLSRI